MTVTVKNIRAKPSRQSPHGADEIVKKLITLGIRTEEIAVSLDVSNNTVLRWRDSRAVPHRSHLARLSGLLMKAQAKKRLAK